MVHEAERAALAVALRRWIKDKYGFDADVRVTDKAPTSAQLFPNDPSQIPERLAATVGDEIVWFEWLRPTP